MNKKVVSLALATTMSLGLLAGCGSDKQSTKPADETTGTKQEVQLTGSQIVAEPTTFTIFEIFSNMPFDSEWEVFKKIGENTNVYLEGTVSKSTSDEETAYNLMLSSGNLPDVIGYKDMAMMDKLGHDGGLIALNDLIDQYAPNIKKYLDENPKAKSAATAADGNIYQIPKFQSHNVAEAYFIRQDWLDKLNLEVPQTIPELHDVLTAFRTQDPNGNGKQDEIPWLDRAGYKMFDDILYVWDASSTFYVRDGKIVFGPLEDQFKVGMPEVVQWYGEGLIDPEIFTRGSKSRDILFGGDMGGFTHDWIGSTTSYNEKLKDVVPGFNLQAMAPVENYSGNRVERTYRSHGPGWGISTACEDPVTLMKYFDYFFSEEGARLINFGIEGVTYNMVDGKPVYTDTVMKSDKTPLSVLRSYGVQYRVGMLQDFEYEKAWITDFAKEVNVMYDEGGYINDVAPFSDGNIILKYTEEQEKEYVKIMSSIKPYVDEMIQKWVLGGTDFDSTYDEFVESLKNRGIERAIEINQEAYNHYMGN